MPLNLPDNLPAIDILKKENIFVMNETRAKTQDIRPMKIAIFNLMPLKIETETHLLRLLSNTPLQIEIDLLRTATYTPTHTSFEHLDAFYKVFDDIKEHDYDGLIITGAPVEKMDFEDVKYWDEVKEIMDWAKEHVTSTLYICWAAQAGLYHHFNIPKYLLDKKVFGVFEHKVLNHNIPLVRGFNDYFLAPHSRYTTVLRKDIEKIDNLEILAESKEAGVYLVITKDGKHIFVTGHSEYSPLTLKKEYERDVAKGLDIDLPKNYFPDDDPNKDPIVMWRSHANLLFQNWINYYVYQETPYKLR